MRYYIFDEKQPNGFLEVTKGEYIALFGDEVTGPYVQAVYRGDIVIDDVPGEHREAVQTIVANKVSQWGMYEDQEATEDDYQAELRRMGVKV